VWRDAEDNNHVGDLDHLDDLFDVHRGATICHDVAHLICHVDDDSIYHDDNDALYHTGASGQAEGGPGAAG